MFFLRKRKERKIAREFHLALRDEFLDVGVRAAKAGKSVELARLSEQVQHTVGEHVIGKICKKHGLTRDELRAILDRHPDK